MSAHIHDKCYILNTDIKAIKLQCMRGFIEPPLTFKGLKDHSQGFTAFSTDRVI